MKKVAIIGAGFSGLTLAYELRNDAAVTVVEKSRGVGGRMSTRRTDQTHWDHGAQFFTARSRRFKKFLQPFIKNGSVGRWNPRITTLSHSQKPYGRIWFEPHYVGIPSMNSLCKSLATDLNIQLNTEIRQLLPVQRGWSLVDSQGNTWGDFDWVINTAPSPQTLSLFPADFSQRDQLSAVKMSGCWAVIIQMADPPSWSWQAAVVKDSPIAWLALNHSKPQRDGAQPALIIHSDNAWADENRQRPSEEVTTRLLKELYELTGWHPRPDDDIHCHHWRFAKVTQAASADFLVDERLKLLVCGDGCVGGRVESAFRSASRAARFLRQRLESGRT